MEDNIVLSKTDLEQAITKSVVEAWKQFNPVKDVPVNNETSTPGDSFAKLLSGIYKNDRTLIKAADPMSEGTAGEGGYLVPSITQAKILELTETYGQGRKLFQRFPLGKTGKVVLPKLNTDVAAYWVNEEASITSSKPTLETISLEAKKLAALVVVSNELLEDAIVDVGNFVINRISRAFGKKEDNAFFNNTSPFTGLFKVSSSNFGNFVNIGSADPTDLTYENLLDAVYNIDQSLLDGAVWLMHRTWLSVIRKLKDTTGQPLFYPANDGNIGTLMGFPVKLIEQAPVASTMSSGSVGIILGNPNNSLYGAHSEMRVTILTEATIDGTSLGQYDLSAIRVIERVAFDPGLTKGYSAIGYVST